VGPPVAFGLETFRNRHHERELLRRYLFDPSTRLVTVTGRRGMGKSALAAKVVETLVEGKWPDGLLLPDNRGIVNASTRTAGISLERIYTDCARLFAPSVECEVLDVWSGGATVFDKIQRLMELLEGGWYLIVLDNLEDILTEDGRFLDPDLALFVELALRFERGPHILVTTQIPLTLRLDQLRLESRIRLDAGFPVEDGVEFLRELDRDGRAHLDEIPDSDLSRAVVSVYGIPRALELVFGVLAEDYATLPTLDELISTFSSREDVVSNLAQQNYDKLGSAERSVLDIFAMFGCPITREAVRWVVEPFIPDIDLPSVLRRLAQVQMLRVDRASRTYAMHPMDADFIRSRLSPEGAWSQRVVDRRIASWYASVAPPESAWRSLEDVASLRLEFRHRIRAQDFLEAARVLESIGEFMTWRGASAAVGAMHAEITVPHDDPDAELSHLVGFAQARVVTGPYSEAADLLERARALDTESNPGRTLRVQFLLGDVCRHLQRWGEAIEAFERTVALARRLDDWDREAHALLSLCLVFVNLRDAPRAEACADQLEALVDRTGEDLVRGRLGETRTVISLVSERWVEAIDAAEAGIQAFTRAGIIEALCYSRNSQGVAATALGRFLDAADFFNRGWEDSTATNTAPGEALCLYNHAWLNWKTGNHAQAGINAAASAGAFRRCGSPLVGAAESLAQAANAMVEGDRPAACAALRAAAAASNDINLCPADWLRHEADRLEGAGA
jgi:tetratricopeptide (TPR) repeat protein